MDPLHANLNALFTQLFDDALTEYSYMAEIAGLRYSLDSSIYGLTVRKCLDLHLSLWNSLKALVWTTLSVG